MMEKGLEGGCRTLGGVKSIPRRVALPASVGEPQQRAVATPYQREASLDQADDPVTDVMRPPVPFGNAMSREQNLGDLAIRGAIRPGVQRAQRKREPPPAIGRKRMKRHSLRSAIEASPQASPRIESEFKVSVERKFNGICSSEDRRLFEPEAVLYAMQMHHGVPTVSGLPQLAIIQIEGKSDARVCA